MKKKYTVSLSISHSKQPCDVTFLTDLLEDKLLLYLEKDALLRGRDTPRYWLWGLRSKGLQSLRAGPSRLSSSLGWASPGRDTEDCWTMLHLGRQERRGQLAHGCTLIIFSPRLWRLLLLCSEILLSAVHVIATLSRVTFSVAVTLFQEDSPLLPQHHFQLCVQQIWTWARGSRVLLKGGTQSDCETWQQQLEVNREAEFRQNNNHFACVALKTHIKGIYTSWAKQPLLKGIFDSVAETFERSELL